MTPDALETMVEDWLAACELRQLSPKSLEVYRGYTRRLVRWHRETGRAFDAPSLRAWYAERARSTSPRSLDHLMTVTRALCRFGAESGHLPSDPAAAIPRPVLPEREQPAPFTREEAARLASAARAAGRRDAALFAVLLDCGLRASELCALTLRDISWTPNGGALSVAGKGRKRRGVPFSQTTRVALRAWLRERGEAPEDAPLFVVRRGLRTGQALRRHTLQVITARWGEAAGVAHVHPHRWRHTAAVTLLNNGADVRTVQLLLGHSSIAQTAKYLRPSAADIAERHHRASPMDSLRRGGR